MTSKQIAKRLRVLADAPTLSIENRGELDRMANELDPPRPEPGTVVWWRYSNTDWELGIVFDEERITDYNAHVIDFVNIEYKPASILGPRQVAVEVPPVGEWPTMADEADLRWHYGTGTIPPYANVTITRTEAEAMEDER